MTETWHPIPGHPGYEASSLGRVGSWHRINPTHRPLVERRLLRPKVDRGGYLTVQILDADGRQIGRWVHHLVTEAFHGPRPSGREVRHLNDHRQDNRASNLAWGTHAENMRDLLRNGRHPQAIKTRCPASHPYDDANTYVDRTGARHCRACRRERAALRRAA